MAVGNYSTLDGTTTALETLKRDIGHLKSKCTNAVLDNDSEDWAAIVKILQEFEDQFDTIISNSKSNSTEMENIAATFKS